MPVLAVIRGRQSRDAGARWARARGGDSRVAALAGVRDAGEVRDFVAAHGEADEPAAAGVTVNMRRHARTHAGREWQDTICCTIGRAIYLLMTRQYIYCMYRASWGGE